MIGVLSKHSCRHTFIFRRANALQSGIYLKLTYFLWQLVLNY